MDEKKKEIQDVQIKTD